MGLLDYYRQFEDMDQEEVNQGLRERRRREKELALQQVPELDLSGSEWPELPHSEVVNAAIAAARGRVNRYPDRHAGRVRALLAERHGVEPEQIVLGNGAGELLQATAHALLRGGGELVTAWPSYPLYPLMASRAGGRPVAVDLAGGRVDPDALLEATGPETRAVVVCNPNDPTGTHVAASRLGELAAALDGVHLLLDEALIDFQDAEPADASLALLGEHPNVVVYRTFSKAWGLSGLRAGYAIAAPEQGRLLEAISPALGVNALTQAALEHALRAGDAPLAARRTLVAEERGRLLAALHDLPVDAADSRSAYVWLRAVGLSGAELAARLEREKVLVAPGGPLGDEEHVRATLSRRGSGERLAEALAAAVGR